MQKLTTTDNQIIDPVCGMTVDPDKTDLLAVFQGDNYYFCAEGCRIAFENKPLKYLKPKRKGWLGRYMDRLARANEKSFGCAGPKCH